MAHAICDTAPAYANQHTAEKKAGSGLARKKHTGRADRVTAKAVVGDRAGDRDPNDIARPGVFQIRAYFDSSLHAMLYNEYQHALLVAYTSAARNTSSKR